jgi:hypothetical protein
MGVPACPRLCSHWPCPVWFVHYCLRTLTELEAKGTYFLIISLLVSSNAVVKETKTLKSFSASWSEEDTCTVLMLSVGMDLSFCDKICFFYRGLLPSLPTNRIFLTFSQKMEGCYWHFLFGKNHPHSWLIVFHSSSVCWETGCWDGSGIRRWRRASQPALRGSSSRGQIMIVQHRDCIVTVLEGGG